MEQFYSFGSKGYLTTFAAVPELSDYAVDNGYYGFHSGRGLVPQLVFAQRYPLHIQFPIVYRQCDGKRMRDLLDMRWVGSCFLISDRVKAILETNGFTGWKSYPIRLYDKKGNPISGYSGFTVTGRGGRVFYAINKGWDYSVQLQPCWNPAWWDGSDFFGFDNTLQIIVTERVRTVLKNNKVDAVDFKSLTEDGYFCFDPDAGKKEAGYAAFSIVHHRPASYQQPQRLDCPLNLVLHQVESALQERTVIAVENCLELAERHAIEGRSRSNLSLLHMENEAKTEGRVFRYMALEESLYCCQKAIESIDNAACLLLGKLDPASFTLQEYKTIPDEPADPAEWDRFMDWHIATMKVIHISIYNALAGIQEKLVKEGRITPEMDEYLENALMQLAQSISILTEAS